MDDLREIFKKRYSSYNNVNNDIKYNNDINVTFKKKKNYALDKSKFKPNTPEADCAIEIAEKLKDTSNFAFYRSIVNKIGCINARRLLSELLDSKRSKENTKYPIRNMRRYFAWMYKYKYRNEAK